MFDECPSNGIEIGGCFIGDWLYEYAGKSGKEWSASDVDAGAGVRRSSVGCRCDEVAYAEEWESCLRRPRL